jgi:signal transduction histidine kinase
MISFPPKSLQTTLIFYITCIIIFTNGFFAVVTLSRENLLFMQDTMNRSMITGRILRDAAREFFATGNPQNLERNINDLSVANELRITLYDTDWWQKWGHPSRIPPEGFPPSLHPGQIVFRSGVSGETTRELFFAVASDSLWLGTLGIGIPEMGSPKAYASLVQVFLTTGTNILLGIALAVFISQIILRPLSMLLEGLEAIRQGDFSQRIQIQGNNELAVLGQLFNVMAASLQEKTREGLERTRILDEKVQELWEIYELTKVMGFSLNLQQVLERFLEKAQTLSFSSYGMILLFAPESHRLEPRVATNSCPGVSQAVFDTHLQTCLQKGETQEVVENGQTLMFVPLLSGRLVQGVLFLGKQGTQFYSESIRRFLETISPLGGSLIENAELYDRVVAMKDYVQNVLDSVDSGVVTLDCDGRLASANESFKGMFALTEPLHQGETIANFLRDLPDRRFCETFENIALGRVSKLDPPKALHPTRQEIPFSAPGQDDRIIQLRATRLLERESLLGRVVVIDDITSLKHMEKRMLDAEKWVVLGRLAASIAHEIRNPLVAIRGLAEVIGETLEGEHKEHIRVIIGEVHRLNNVVEQLLHLSRPEQTRLETISLRQMLQELLVLLRHEAAKTRVSLSADFPPEDCPISIDSEKIKQAFLNIMLNGIQAMPDGGELHITLSQGDNSPENDPEDLVVAFQDTGIGIPLENLERIFDPFFTTRATGTGLGLAMARKIFDLHHGRIEVSSISGQGTTVRCILPLRNPENGQAGSP